MTFIITPEALTTDRLVTGERQNHRVGGRIEGGSRQVRHITRQYLLGCVAHVAKCEPVESIFYLKLFEGERHELARTAHDRPRALLIV